MNRYRFIQHLADLCNKFSTVEEYKFIRCKGKQISSNQYMPDFFAISEEDFKRYTIAVTVLDKTPVFVGDKVRLLTSKTGCKDTVIINFDFTEITTSNDITLKLEEFNEAAVLYRPKVVTLCNETFIYNDFPIEPIDGVNKNLYERSIKKINSLLNTCLQEDNNLDLIISTKNGMQHKINIIQVWN